MNRSTATREVYANLAGPRPRYRADRCAEQRPRPRGGRPAQGLPLGGVAADHADDRQVGQRPVPHLPLGRASSASSIRPSSRAARHSCGRRRRTPARSAPSASSTYVPSAAAQQGLDLVGGQVPVEQHPGQQRRPGRPGRSSAVLTGDAEDDERLHRRADGVLQREQVGELAGEPRASPRRPAATRRHLVGPPVGPARPAAASAGGRAARTSGPSSAVDPAEHVDDDGVTDRGGHAAVQCPVVGFHPHRVPSGTPGRVRRCQYGGGHVTATRPVGVVKCRVPSRSSACRHPGA